MNRARIFLSSPHMGDKELEYVKEAFATNWISPVGPHITAFENDLAQYNNIAHCAALSSGTAAIHLALIVLGVQRNDEVVCSTFTFSGSCNPIAYLGAIPVFIDSEKETWNMDPVLLEEAIVDRIKKAGKKPKAIIAVHLYGMPAKIEAIMAISKKHDIPVIEDAAEALGSSVNGKKLGTFGDIGIYSFNGNKIITTSGGGALVSENEAWVNKTRFLATQARDPAPHYEHSEIGYNYRLSNICAGIGRGQLEVLDRRIEARRKMFHNYQTVLQQIQEITFLKEPSDGWSNRWLTTILLNSNNEESCTPEQLRLYLEEHNVESRPLWKPMHMQKIFKEAPAYINGVSENLFKHGICLPSGSNLNDSEISFINSLLLKKLIKK